jgi:hydrogenase maturation protease
VTAGGWEELQAPAPRTVLIGGVEVRGGSRVVLRPRRGGDVFDMALAGKVAVVESVEQDMDGHLHLAVTLEDDPGRDLGRARQPGHRFFFSVDEAEPLVATEGARARVLVAGIGNIFLGDDGFGVEVARRLAHRRLAPGVTLQDFGIRGMDLVYALGDGYDVVILLDAVPRGQAPGTLYVIEVQQSDDGVVSLDTHGMDPVRVLRLARELGPVPERVVVVGCEPEIRPSGEDEELVGALSEPVRAAVDGAVELVESLVEDIMTPKGSDEGEVSG